MIIPYKKYEEAEKDYYKKEENEDGLILIDAIDYAIKQVFIPSFSEELLREIENEYISSFYNSVDIDELKVKHDRESPRLKIEGITKKIEFESFIKGEGKESLDIVRKERLQKLKKVEDFLNGPFENYLRSENPYFFTVGRYNLRPFKKGEAMGEYNCKLTSKNFSLEKRNYDYVTPSKEIFVDQYSRYDTCFQVKSGGWWKYKYFISHFSEINPEYTEQLDKKHILFSFESLEEAKRIIPSLTDLEKYIIIKDVAIGLSKNFRNVSEKIYIFTDDQSFPEKYPWFYNPIGYNDEVETDLFYVDYFYKMLRDVLSGVDPETAIKGYNDYLIEVTKIVQASYKSL